MFALSARKRSLLMLAPLVTGLLSAEVGSDFASAIPLYTALLLPLVFSVYDLYAVFAGPLRQLVTIAPTEVLTAVTSQLGEFSIGTGDTIFYSMLPALALYQFNLYYALYTLVAVDLGVIITLYLLSKSKLLPGLPIPMALGMGTLLFLILGLVLDNRGLRALGEGLDLALLGLVGVELFRSPELYLGRIAIPEHTNLGGRRKELLELFLAHDFSGHRALPLEGLDLIVHPRGRWTSTPLSVPCFSRAHRRRDDPVAVRVIKYSARSVG